MGTQSIIHPSRHKHAPLRIALLLLLCCIAPLTVCAQTATVSALTIPLILPSAIAFDATGNLYFAETGNHVIRKLDTTGNMTSIAGNGTQGSSGDAGPATSASLDSPQGLALDAANNLYIADTHNHRVRKLNLTTGILTTIAGSAPGFSGDSGFATSAQLNLPTALAIDATGNLYIADTGNHRIRKITVATGIITTVAGTGTQGFSGDTGPATSAAIDSPTGLALDAAGDLFLADTHNHRIRKITASTGTIITIAGSGSPGFSGDATPSTSANLDLPHGLTLDTADNLYLADTANHRIRRIEATTGIITTVAGDGTQAFSGDGGPAVAASLDSPSATALTPAGLLTLSDTGNQRIRQLNAQPAAATTVTTIAGLGITTPGALSLSAPSVIPYGTGQLTASLTAPATAAGSITFLDITNAPITLGTAPLVANLATLPIGTLPAGFHSFTATYAGDVTIPSTQSSALTVKITPQQLAAAISPVALLYGQPIPTITGTLTGILPQDAANLSATFTSSATSQSSVGTYPITTTLTGPAAGNYIVATTPAAVIIHPAPTITALSDLVASAATGSTVTLTAYVASTTPAEPTGSVTLLDGAVPISTMPISAIGVAVFTTNSLASGSHTLTAVYNGNTNFSPGASAPQLITVGTGPTGNPDFALSATGATTQTILSGSSASFSFAAQMQGNLSSAITLAAAGLPNLATASFNPPILIPGGATNAFTMTISTPNTTASEHRPGSNPPRSSLTWAFLLCPTCCLFIRLRKHNATAKLLIVAITTLALTFAIGCGDRINSAAVLATPAKTYTITVTGTATALDGTPLQHSTTVTLILQQPS